MSMDIGAFQDFYTDVGAFQFTSPITTTFSGNINLFIHGKDFLTDNLNLFIHGQNSINDQFTLFISTTNVFANTVDLFIHGQDNSSDNLNLSIAGSIAESNDIDLFIHGLDSFFETLDLFIRGPESISGLLNLTVLNLIPVTDNLNLFIKGPILEKNNLDLFIFGYAQSILSTLFLKTAPNDIATSRSLCIYGSPSGIDLNFAGQEIDLFIKSSFEDSIYPPITSGYTSLFMPVSSGSIFGSGYWPLFLASDTSISNSIDLYISTHEKTASGFIDLFIARIPDFPGEDGFTPINNNWTLFLKTIIGEIDILNLFVSGYIPEINNDINCFIEGIYTIDDNLNLTIMGISGSINDYIDFYVYGIDRLITEITFFIRGY